MRGKKGFSLAALTLSALFSVGLVGCQDAPWQLDPFATNGRDGGGIPLNYDTLMRIGAASRAGGDFPNALSLYRRAASIEGNLPAPFVAMGNTLLDMGSVDEAIEKETYKRFYMHRTSHWLGRDVHDVGSYARDGGPRPLEPGMVLTVEPGLYMPANAEDLPAEFRGVGIRIEDDVLVTESGHEVLSAAAPKQVAEIEALRAEAG